MGRGLHLEGCCAILLPPLPSFFLCNQIAQAENLRTSCYGVVKNLFREQPPKGSHPPGLLGGWRGLSLKDCGEISLS